MLRRTRIVAARRSAPGDQLIPTLAAPVAPFRDRSRAEVFQRHKTSRSGLNRVVLGVAVSIPFRPDRPFCLPVLWRLDRKEGSAGYRTRPRAAAALARKRAEANPGRTFWPVGDSASVNAAVLQGRPTDLQVIGPLHREAGRYEPPGPSGGKGRRPKEGPRRPAPKAMIEDTAGYPAEALGVASPKVTRTPRVQVIRDVLWYRGSKDEPVRVVLVRDPLGRWRDEALVATDPGASASLVIPGYCRRWCVGLASFDSEQYLGLRDPRVRSARSVGRAHPMAWLIGSLTVLWYCLGGHQGPQVERGRPWYTTKVTPTSTDMRGALRLQMWEYEVFGRSEQGPPSPECLRRLLHTLAAGA